MLYQYTISDEFLQWKSSCSTDFLYFLWINFRSFIYGRTRFTLTFEDKNNIWLDKNEALEWFYAVFFCNLDIQDNAFAQERLKTYIPMKALVTYHTIRITDEEDN